MECCLGIPPLYLPMSPPPHHRTSNWLTRAICLPSLCSGERKGPKPGSKWILTRVTCIATGLGACALWGRGSGRRMAPVTTKVLSEMKSGWVMSLDTEPPALRPHRGVNRTNWATPLLLGPSSVERKLPFLVQAPAGPCLLVGQRGPWRQKPRTALPARWGSK